MFDITSVELVNFRSYAGTHRVEFPREPGLYFITGTNEANPRLGQNGVGKTTLIEAIHWCFYGCTSRGLRAADVLTWNTNNQCSVTANVTICDRNIRVYRTQSPNSLTVFENDEETIVDQQQLESMLRLGQESFTHAVMIPQFRVPFFDLTPGAKLALFSSIMNLEFWLNKSNEALALSTQLKEQIVIEETGLSGHVQQKERAFFDVEELKAQKAGFSSAQTEIIKKLEKEMKDSVNEQKALEKAIQRSKGSALTAEEKAANALRALKLVEGQQGAANDVLKALTVDKAVLNEKCAETTRALAKLGSVGKECPTCLQPVAASHISHKIKDGKKGLERLQAELESVTSSIAGKNDDFDKLVKKAEGYTRDLQQINRNRADFEVELHALQNKTRGVALEQIFLKKQIESETNKINPFNKLLKDKIRFLTECEKTIAGTKASAAKLHEDNSAVTYWISGYKKIRLLMIEEALGQLELEVNNNLSNLGLTDWSIEFDIERENKAGGITKGFVVWIKAPYCGKPVRWESWSGGETQRLRLAGDFGLANLIMERAGLNNTVEFYDEPSTHLSPEGLLDMAETLHQRAIGSGKRVFLVDHNNIEFGEFVDTLFITKNENGPVLEWGRKS